MTKIKERHCNELKNLRLILLAISYNPEEIIVNNPFYQLSDIEKTILAKGLNFNFAQKTFNYADYLTTYKLLFRNVRKFSMDDCILERVKVDTKKI